MEGRFLSQIRDLYIGIMIDGIFIDDNVGQTVDGVLSGVNLHNVLTMFWRCVCVCVRSGDGHSDIIAAPVSSDTR